MTDAADLEVLPAVAKTIHLDCKKCGVERFFIVVAHTSPTAAKVKCEVCGAQKIFKLASAKKAKKTATGAPKKPRVTKAAAAKAGQVDEYEKLSASSSSDAQAYSMKNSFSLQQKLSHPKFGVGFVRAVMPEKIEVLFQDEIRMLVHNRTT